MKRKLSWKVTVDGEDFFVRCVPHETVFDVYVDDELAIRVPRYSEDGTDLEEEIRLGSKVCRFVVYGGVPDLAVDGILQGVEDAMRRKEIRSRILLVLGGILTATVSSFSAFLWFVFEAADNPAFGDYMSLCFMAIFALCGVGMVFFGLRPKKRY